MPPLAPHMSQAGHAPPMGNGSTEDQDRELLAAIEAYLAGEDHFGIDPRVLRILDSLDSSKSEIAGVEEMIDKMISARLRNMANSIYHGVMRHGNANKFTDVVASLGMRPTKIFIVAMALFSRLGAEYELLEVKSFATSVFARMIAEQMGFDQSSIEKAELGGLFLNLGKVVIATYQFRSRTVIEPAFVEKYHQYFAATIIARFNLPEYLSDFIQEGRLVLQQRAFSVNGIVYLAQCLVETIIGQFGIIEIKSPMPEVKDNLEVTLGSIISEHFNMIGLGKFVKVVPDRKTQPLLDPY